jgi:prepilin-type N-terminal cleavage/methylation domain-containing protein
LPRPAFTLVELLVVVSVILVLMGMIGSAVSAARTSQKKQATQALIAKLDGVIQQHLSSYASRGLSGAATETLAKVELPDNWTDVGGTGTAPQAAYASVRSSISTLTTGVHGDAECLFMIVMQGGVADCLDCAGLALSEMGDKDNDGALEFWDAWGEPIRYVRRPTPGVKIRPLIFSGGPAKLVGAPVINNGSNVSQGFITNFDAEFTK